MANKILKTRIQLKIDTLENWRTHGDVVLLPGEVAIATINKKMPPIVNKAGEVIEPGNDVTEYLLKVGQQGKKFSELEWVSAKAADVYDWAKAAKKPKYDHSEITGLSDEFNKKLGKTEQAADSLKLNGQEASYYAAAATTLAGYKIGDAKIENGVITLGNQTIKPITDISGKADTTVAVGSFKGTDSATITPVSVSGDDLTPFTVNNVAKATAAESATDATNVTTNINGHAITTIFEADGTTVKNATSASKATDATNATKATNVDLKTDGSADDKIKIQAGTGTAAEITINNVANAIKADNLGEHAAADYALKAEAIGTVAEVADHADQISVKALTGVTKDKTITINNVANAKNAEKLGNKAASEYRLIATKVAESELTTELAKKINAKAEASAVNALSGRVDTAEADIDALEGKFTGDAATKAVGDDAGNKISETYATKAETVKSVAAGDSADKIVVTPVTGQAATITVNDVAHATAADSATDVNLSVEGDGTASIKVSAGAGTAASFTVNNVAKATDATNAENVVITNNGSADAKVAFKIGSGSFEHTVNNVANATKAENALKLGGAVADDYALKTYVDAAVAGAVQYWGVVNKAEDLGKDMTSSTSPKPAVTVGKGDFYRVGTAFSTYAIGDLLIANKDNAGSTAGNYYRLKQENGDGTVTSITAGDGLTGGEITSSGTIAHAVPSGAAAGAKGTGTENDRKYIKTITTDEFGHVTGFTEGAETVVDTNRAIKVGGVEKLTASDKSAIDFINGTNTTVVYDASAKTIKIDAVDTKANNGNFTVTGGAGLTGTGSMTADQAGDTTATLAVGAGTGITVGDDNVSVTDYNNILTAKGDKLATEGAGEEYIVFSCGSATDMI